MLKELLLLALTALYMSDATSKTADMDFLHKQKKIYELLLFVKQNTLTDMEFYEIGRNYDIESNIDMYKDKMIVQEFLHMYRQGMLSRNAIYSPYNEEHRQEMKLLYKLLYCAKDFETFYKTAAWARLHLNDSTFMSAFIIAVFYRPDCKYMRLPAPYEIYPNLFFDNTVIQQAHDIKMTRGNAHLTTTNMDNIDSYMIYANYSGQFIRSYYDDEYKMDYWMEDISLNAYYYYARKVMPFWLDHTYQMDFPKDFRGRFYYFMHRQLLARYYLERLSNDLGDIEDFDWSRTFYPGYYSTLINNNGIAMPQRSPYMNMFHKHKQIKDIEALEMRIMNTIDLGYAYDKTGKQINIYKSEDLETLANLIEGNADSCNQRFYGMYDPLARDILGSNFDYKDKNKMIPSSLQCYSTSMRDPGFYRLYKKIMTHFLRYKKNLPYYTQNQLIFPGVKFESVNVDKLQTYFDNCDTFINNALSVESFKEGMKLRVKARRHCLNYKPFTYRFNINSDKETKAVLKIFLGPTFDNVHTEKDISYLRDYYQYFVEMDKFVVTLRQGANSIERRSSDSINTMPDMMSGDVFYEKLEKALGGSEPFTYYETVFDFPERLTLPKGKPEGMRFRMFFYLHPIDETEWTVELPIFGKREMDGKALGFPLDRPMLPQKFLTPNMLFKDVYIYHTSENEKTMQF